MLDRIDIHIRIPKVDYEKLSGDRMGESGESIFVYESKPRGIYKTSISQAMVQMLFATPIYTLVR